MKRFAMLVVVLLTLAAFGGNAFAQETATPPAKEKTSEMKKVEGKKKASKKSSSKKTAKTSSKKASHKKGATKKAPESTEAK